MCTTERPLAGLGEMWSSSTPPEGSTDWMELVPMYVVPGSPTANTPTSVSEPGVVVRGPRKARDVPNSASKLIAWGGGGSTPACSRLLPSTAGGSGAGLSSPLTRQKSDRDGA